MPVFYKVKGKVDNRMISGFSNERTSEYMILNDLYGKISGECVFFYPFYFHRNRDDTKLSMQNDIADLQLTICFSRRPKTDHPKSNLITVTFRDSLFKHADYFADRGFPTIAGSPIGSSIENIGFGSKCQWFQLQAGINESYVEYNFYDYSIDLETVIKDISLLDDISLVNLLRSAPTLSWLEIVHLQREWYEFNMMNRALALYYTIPGQRPIFIAYKLKH